MRIRPLWRTRSAEPLRRRGKLFDGALMAPERSEDVDMTLTAPGCDMGEVLVKDAQEKIAVVPTVADVKVQLVFDPPWNQSMMSDEARLQTGLMY